MTEETKTIQVDKEQALQYLSGVNNISVTINAYGVLEGDAIPAEHRHINRPLVMTAAATVVGRVPGEIDAAAIVSKLNREMAEAGGRPATPAEIREHGRHQELMARQAKELAQKSRVQAVSSIPLNMRPQR